MSNLEDKNTSIAGVENRVRVYQSDNSNTSSNAVIETNVGGTSGGDPYVEWRVGTTRAYALGPDNSSSQILTLRTGTTSASPSSGTTLATMSSAGQLSLPLQNLFWAYLGTTATNKTGTGTAYTLGTDAFTIVTNQSTCFTTGGVFTAAAAGNYNFVGQCRFTGCTAATGFTFTVTLSGGNSYQSAFSRAASAVDLYLQINSGYIPMSASETATFVVAAFGEAGDTVDIGGGSGPYVTFLSGMRVAG